MTVVIDPPELLQQYHGEGASGRSAFQKISQASTLPFRS